MGMWTRIFGKKVPIETDNDKLAVSKVVEEQIQEKEHPSLKEWPQSYYAKEPKISPLAGKPYDGPLAENPTVEDIMPEKEFKRQKKEVLSYHLEPPKPLPSTAEIKKEYKEQVAKAAKPINQQEQTKMDFTVNIIAPPTRGGGKGRGDAFIGKSHKYFRIGENLIKILDVKADDYIIIANFGETMLIAKKPRGIFEGYQLREQQGTQNRHTLICQNISSLKEVGLREGAYKITEDSPVFDKANNVHWVKLRHEMSE